MNNLNIEIADDGRGINWGQIRRKAEKLGLACTSQQDLANVLFDVGVSSLNSTSVLAGRGVGLTAVHEEVKRLSGKIQIDTSPGIGTLFSIEIPLAMLVKFQFDDTAVA